jgi:hypothetical protein
MPIEDGGMGMAGGHITPGSGGGWADGITNSDWTLAGGSRQYRAGKAAGLTDIGGKLYKVNADGSRTLFGEKNGQLGYWESYTEGEPGGFEIMIIDGKPVRVFKNDITIGMRFVPMTAQGGGDGQLAGLEVPLGLWSVGSFAHGVNDNLRAISIAQKNVGMLKQLKNSVRLSVGHPTATDKTIANLLAKNNKMLQGMKLGAKRMVFVGTVIGMIDVANANPEDRMNKAAWVALDTAVGVMALSGFGTIPAGIYFAGRFAYGVYEMTNSGGN